jgi:hypothetical protein
MTTLRPAKPDGQSRTNPIIAPDERTPPATELFVRYVATEPKDVLDLEHGVRDGLEVRHPDAVFILGPANTFLAIRITRRRHGYTPDVTQRPLRLREQIVQVPEGWLEPGDHIAAERMGSFEPRPPAPAASPGSSWIGGEAGGGAGDFIGRRR